MTSASDCDTPSRGYHKGVPALALEAIRITAERARRFADDVEREPTDDQRMRRLRTALMDLDEVVHVARTQGVDAEEIHLALRGPTGRFTRDRSRTRALL